MKTLISLFVLFLLPRLFFAQGFSGEYLLAANGAEAVFTVEQEGWNRLRGTLVDSDGAEFRMQAVVEKKYVQGILQEYARGTLVNSSQSLYFEAYLNEPRLVVAAMPYDAYGQPDYLSATDFVFTRLEKQKPPIELGEKQPQREESSYYSNRPSGSQGVWDGAYDGKIKDVDTKLTIQRYGNLLSGEIDAGGYRYLLDGTITGTTSQGEVTDTQTGGRMDFSATLDQDSIVVLFSGEKGQFRMSFQREGTGPASPARVGMDRDPALAGSWSSVQRQQPGPGRPARTREMLLILNPNGLFQYGEAKALREALKRGRNNALQWMTRDNQILVLQDSEWKKFAAYQLNGATLTLKLNNGSLGYWTRVN